MAVATNERSLADVLHDILSNVRDIIRSEFRLAQAEMGDQFTKARGAMVMLASGAVSGMAAGALLLTACVLALSMVMQAWLAAVIVGVVCGIAAAALIVAGRKMMQKVNPRPQRTIDSVRENVAWVRGQSR
jgi:hypothetical protein